MLGPRNDPTSCQPGEITAAGDWKPDADVELPQRPPDATRQTELERRHDPTGSHDPRQLGKCDYRILDVADQVRERERVERAVGKRKLLGAALAQRDPVGQAGGLDPRLRAGEHLGLWSMPTTRQPFCRDELDRHRGRPGRHVEHRAVGPALDPGDEEPPPARVLSQRAAGSNGRRTGRAGAKRSRATRFRSEKEGTGRV